VFTAWYALSPYITQVSLVLKELKVHPYSAITITSANPSKFVGLFTHFMQARHNFIVTCKISAMTVLKKFTNLCV